MTERGVTIGRVAAQVGLTRKAIRFYERKSLIPPPERGSNRYRLYDAEAVEMLRFIKQAQFVGLKLAEIKEIVAIRRRGKAPCARVQLMLQNKVVDLDLAKFFDEVNHQRLMWLLGSRIGDKRLLRLIVKILKTDILSDGLQEQRIKGTPQGSPLSPLLSNIVLDELDQELSRRGLSFVRYADDVQILVSSQKSAERVQESIINFIEKKMKLKVNREKSGIKPCYKVNFLGYSLMNGGKLGLSQSSKQRLKDKLRMITQRNRGVSLEQILKELKVVLQGWLHYFQLAQMKSQLIAIEGWLRRRLKCFRLKQCKRAIGIVRFLMKLGVEKTLCWRTALSGKGWWRISNSPALSIGMNNRWFLEQGFYSLTENYKQLFRSSL